MRVRSAVLYLEAFTVDEVQRMTGLGRASVRTELNRMKKAGYLVSHKAPKTKAGRGAPPHIYRLTDDPQRRLELARSVQALQPPASAPVHASEPPVRTPYQEALQNLASLEQGGLSPRQQEALIEQTSHALGVARAQLRSAVQGSGLQPDEVAEALLSVLEGRLKLVQGHWAEAQAVLARARSTLARYLPDDDETCRAADHLLRASLELALADLESNQHRRDLPALLNMCRTTVKQTISSNPLLSPLEKSLGLAAHLAHSLAQNASRAIAAGLSDRQAELESKTMSIRIVGIGGAGGHIVHRMHQMGVRGAELVAVNTDANALLHCQVPFRIPIGGHITRGLGAGGDIQIGYKAALEASEELRELVHDAHMIVLVTGLGGGTGSGATPVIARLAREAGALVIALVCTPFPFEGTRRVRTAAAGLRLLAPEVDKLITIPTERLLSFAGNRTSLQEAFAGADEIICQGARSVTDLIAVPGLVNIDPSDLRAIVSVGGTALIGTGEASGKGRATKAARQASYSPLLDLSIAGARGLIYNVECSPDVSLFELEEVASILKNAVDPDANIIFGAAVKEDWEDCVRVVLIATGLAASGDSDKAAAGPQRT